jgi:hypothetical protein
MPPPAFPLAESRSALAATPAILEAVVRPLPPSVLNANEGPGTWSPLQVVSHLVWGEIDDWMPRVRRLLSQTGEAFTPFDREEGFARFDGWSHERLLVEFRRLRAQSLRELDALALDAGRLRLEGRHPEFGRVTLEELLATWITHDWAHITQISRVTTRHYGQWVGPWRRYFSLLKAVQT